MLLLKPISFMETNEMMRAKWIGAGLLTFGMALSAGAAKPDYKFTIHSATGQDVGTVTLSPTKKGVKVHIALHDVPFGPHGVHFHQNPVCEGPDFKSSGGHFNPEGKQHGFSNPMGPHAGDTPQNIQVGEDHRGEATFTLSSISLDPNSTNSVLNTSLIVHEHADDMMTDPSGNSGNRIACAVIKP